MEDYKTDYIYYSTSSTKIYKLVHEWAFGIITNVSIINKNGEVTRLFYFDIDENEHKFTPQYLKKEIFDKNLGIRIEYINYHDNLDMWIEDSHIKCYVKKDDIILIKHFTADRNNKDWARVHKSHKELKNKLYKKYRKREVKKLQDNIDTITIKDLDLIIFNYIID